MLFDYCLGLDNCGSVDFHGGLIHFEMLLIWDEDPFESDKAGQCNILIHCPNDGLS